MDELDGAAASGKAGRIRSTTVVAVLRDGHVAIAADGQVTLGETVMKQTAEKVRRIGQGRALIGFAGGVADALTLMERLESKLESHPGNIRRAAVELARDWRTDRVLRKLEAMILLGDTETLLMVSGNGDVIEPDDGVAAIGSGGGYALAAARSLAAHTTMSATEISEAAIKVAAGICIYTNDNIKMETLP
ncbi:MAG TPA: ATP-dependent protease subunit HslV [Myxococcales bacterium]|nr:ATP-dependent protease subunit HslV [Myxococcales bacterium]HIK86662.1 ATP-dependent protease subunit HslV [Myxococcales bacterium]